jgi:hypothetical protein
MLHDDEENPKECSNAFHKESPIPFPMQEPQPPAAPIRFGDPVCPYCGADPANIRGRNIQVGPYSVLVLRCANENCRKIFSAFMVGFEESQVKIPTPGGYTQ